LEEVIKPSVKSEYENPNVLHDSEKNITKYSPQVLDYMMVSTMNSIKKKKKENKRKMNKSTNYMKNKLRRHSDKFTMDRSASFMTPVK
jgi:hypothetical protein